MGEASSRRGEVRALLFDGDDRFSLSSRVVESESAPSETALALNRRR